VHPIKGLSKTIAIDLPKPLPVSPIVTNSLRRLIVRPGVGVKSTLQTLQIRKLRSKIHEGASIKFQRPRTLGAMRMKWVWSPRRVNVQVPNAFKWRKRLWLEQMDPPAGDFAMKTAFELLGWGV
jgi:hypothetical protein